MPVDQTPAIRDSIPIAFVIIVEQSVNDRAGEYGDRRPQTVNEDTALAFTGGNTIAVNDARPATSPRRGFR